MSFILIYIYIYALKRFVHTVGRLVEGYTDISILI